MGGRIIDHIKPLVALMPEVAQPPTDPRTGKDKLPLENKVMWTLAALIIYLVCSQIPLYGITASSSSDAFYIMRMILASNKNTLMELGITPIITSGMILQLLVGAKILDVDMNKKEDRSLFNAAQKLLGIVITLGEALAYVLAGNYGSVSELGAVVALGLVLQLFFAGMLMIMLDDVLGKGWGMGGGINLFIVTNICEGILWALFSPITLTTSTGALQFEGALVNAVHALYAERTFVGKLKSAFLRSDLPNLTNAAATAAVFLLVIYIQGWTNTKTRLRPENQVRGAPARTFPIKLFYTSNMPIILLSALISQVYFFSQLLYRRYASNPLVRLLGVWDERSRRPVWGVAYLFSPPGSLTEVWEEPFHALFYIGMYLGACALFAQMWLAISGSGPDQVVKQLTDPSPENAGGWWLADAPKNKAKLKSVISSRIKTAAMLGGICVGALSIGADLLGAIGSGTGILMAVTLIYDLYDKIRADGGVQELLKKMNPVAGRTD